MLFLRLADLGQCRPLELRGVRRDRYSAERWSGCDSADSLVLAVAENPAGHDVRSCVNISMYMFDAIRACAQEDSPAKDLKNLMTTD